MYWIKSSFRHQKFQNILNKLEPMHLLVKLSVEIYNTIAISILKTLAEVSNICK